MKRNILELTKKNYRKAIENYNYFEACDNGAFIGRILKKENKNFSKVTIKNNADSAFEAYKMCEKEFEKYELQENNFFYMTSNQINDNNERCITFIY